MNGNHITHRLGMLWAAASPLSALPHVDQEWARPPLVVRDRCQRWNTADIPRIHS
jgi:hypothetical protein